MNPKSHTSSHHHYYSPHPNNPPPPPLHFSKYKPFPNSVPIQIPPPFFFPFFFWRRGGPFRCSPHHPARNAHQIAWSEREGGRVHVLLHQSRCGGHGSTPSVGGAARGGTTLCRGQQPTQLEYSCEGVWRGREGGREFLKCVLVVLLNCWAVEDVLVCSLIKFELRGGSGLSGTCVFFLHIMWNMYA